MKNAVLTIVSYVVAVPVVVLGLTFMLCVAGALFLVLFGSVAERIYEEMGGT